jgi:hypothetical protein
MRVRLYWKDRVYILLLIHNRFFEMVVGLGELR